MQQGCEIGEAAAAMVTAQAKVRTDITHAGICTGARGAIACGEAGWFFGQVELQALGARMELIPLRQRLAIDCPYLGPSCFQQITDQVSADKTSGTGHQNSALIRLRHDFAQIKEKGGSIPRF